MPQRKLTHHLKQQSAKRNAQSYIQRSPTDHNTLVHTRQQSEANRRTTLSTTLAGRLKSLRGLGSSYSPATQRLAWPRLGLAWLVRHTITCPRYLDKAVDKLWPRSVESVSAKRALKKLHSATKLRSVHRKALALACAEHKAEIQASVEKANKEWASLYKAMEEGLLSPVDLQWIVCKNGFLKCYWLGAIRKS